MGVVTSTYQGGKKIVGWFQYLFALGILTILGIGGAVLVGYAISELFYGKTDALVLLALGLVGIGFPIVFIYEKIRDRKLMQWLAENVEGLVDGVEGPGGVVYRLDTVLVRYEANLSAILVSTGFHSGFYVHGRSHLIPKIFYTLFTVLFGWWAYNWPLWIANAAAIAKNLELNKGVRAL